MNSLVGSERIASSQNDRLPSTRTRRQLAHAFLEPLGNCLALALDKLQYHLHKVQLADQIHQLLDPTYLDMVPGHPLISKTGVPSDFLFS